MIMEEDYTSIFMETNPEKGGEYTPLLSLFIPNDTSNLSNSNKSQIITFFMDDIPLCNFRIAKSFGNLLLYS